MEIDWSKVKMMDEQTFRMTKSFTGEQKMWIASKIHEEAVALLKSYIKSKNPGWNEKEIIKEIFKFLHNIDLDEMRIADGREEKQRDAWK